MNKKIISLVMGLIFLTGLVIAGVPEHTFISDTMTYIKGKLGIGTDNPSVELEVVGDTIISGELNTNNLVVDNTTISSNIVGVSSEGVVLYFPARDGDISWDNTENGIISDASPNTNNNGLIYNVDNSTFISAKDENLNAMNFDGVNDKISLNEIEVTSTSFWINFNTLGTKKIFQKTTGEGIFALRDNFYAIYNGTDYVLSPITPDTNTWYFVTYVYEGTGYRLYVDGIKSSLLECSNKIPITQIGVPGIFNINGSIAQPLIYDRALSEDEITALYNRQKVYFTDNNPAGRLGDYGIKGDLIMSDLNGTGNDYACIDENGTLYRSAGACS